MEVETAYTLNPDIHAYNGDGGYGLVQWTPGSKLRNWAQSNGLNFKTINTQCRRIQYELEHDIKQYSIRSCKLSFKQYIHSYSSPDYLAECFMYNYENPSMKYAYLENRRKKAIEWFKYF